MSRPETVELWRRRSQRFDPASMTVARFCQLEGVSQASFYKWKKKLHELSHQPSPRPTPPTEDTQEVSFLPLPLLAAAESVLPAFVTALVLLISAVSSGNIRSTRAAKRHSSWP